MDRRDRVYAVLFGAAALGLYVLTLSPDVFWGDAAQLQYLAGEPEFGATPRSYPLFIAGAHLIWRLTPVSPAVAANLFAALCGAVAVSLCWIVAWRESGSRFGAAVGALTLAVSHLHWSSSASAEVYSLSAVFLLVLLLLVRRAADARRGAVFTAGLVIGLSFLHHRVLPFAAAIAAVPILVSWLRHGVALRAVGFAGAGFLVGIVPFVKLLLTSPDGPLHTFFDGTGFQLPGASPGSAGILTLCLYVAVFVAFTFPGPQILVAMSGILRSLRAPSGGSRVLLALLLTGLGLPFLFPHLGDRFIFLLPATVALPIYAGIGAARLRTPWTAVLLATVILLPVATYALTAAFVEPGMFGRFHGAGKEHLVSTFWPGRRVRAEPREYALQVLDRMPPGSLVVRHWGEGQVIRYLQVVEGTRTDLELVSAHVPATDDAIRQAHAEGRSVFLTTYPFLPMPPESAERFAARVELIPGRLWRIDQP